VKLTALGIKQVTGIYILLDALKKRAQKRQNKNATFAVSRFLGLSAGRHGDGCLVLRRLPLISRTGTLGGGLAERVS
jgi:hypothetical protein